MTQGIMAMWTAVRDAVWVSEHDNLGIAGGGGSLNGPSWAQVTSEKIPLVYCYDMICGGRVTPASIGGVRLVFVVLVAFCFCFSTFYVLFLWLHIEFSDVGTWNL